MAKVCSLWYTILWESVSFLFVSRTLRKYKYRGMKMIERTTSHEFELISKYQPAGDQPEAIHQLVDGVVGARRRRFCWGQLEQGKPILFQT